MRTVILTLISLLLASMVIGASIVFFGLFNVSSRGGHWPVVSWALHTTYRQSVALRAPPESIVPDLDDDDLVALGARHYQLSCASCHGQPGARQLRTMTSMLPAPPPIKEAVSGWQANELFWIVKNGVKMSGMPHWPALDRDDDIWPVIAFLNTVPELTTLQYRALLDGDEDFPTPKTTGLIDGRPEQIHGCTMCHGTSGSSDNEHVPRLDILSKQYIAESLIAYRAQQRSSGIMQQAASQLDDETIEALANHYARSDAELEELQSKFFAMVKGPAQPVNSDAAQSSAARGRLLANGTAMIKPHEQEDMPHGADVPACAACHGPWPEALPPYLPIIASQPANYLFAQLQLWKSGNRGGTPLSRLMHKAVPELDERQIRDLSEYYASLSLTGNAR